MASTELAPRSNGATAALYDKYLRRVLADGAWPALLPLPADGLVLVPSRSVEDGDHEVRIRGRHVARCTGPCGAHATCYHRCAAALAVWQHEHPGWDVAALRDERGAPRTALLTALIQGYLAPPPRHRRPYFAARGVGVGLPERRLEVAG